MTDGKLDRRFVLGALGGAAGVAAITKIAQGGPLSPPVGSISPTGKTVQDIYDKISRTDVGLAEPRIPVQSLPGSAAALYVISQPGSYYLTGNIQGVAGKDGIQVAADNVTIDLCGYTLQGVSGSGTGVNMPESRAGAWVHNGTVNGWGQSGVNLRAFFRSCRASHLHCYGNEQHGIATEWQAFVLNCVTDYNADAGIVVNESSTVRNCYARGNGGVGIAASFNCLVEGCNVCGGESGGDGIRSFFGDTTIRYNYVSRYGNGVHIQGPNAVVDDNVISDASSAGIRVEATRCLISRNKVRSDATAYAIAAGNSYGPIVNVAGVGVITSVANANHPWANFIY